jgi:uncharacterized membrane protein
MCPLFKTRILHLLELISTKFWIIPLLCLFIAALAAYVNITIDKAFFPYDESLYSFLFYFSDAQTLRTILTTTAGSLLGVAGVSFSVTITSLVLASQQFGPRLLRNFMRDTFNQAVIGIFISTFLYCMLILQFTSNMEESQFTPIVSMITVLALVMVDLLLLVLYIHHIANSIQVDTIISGVYEELKERLERLFPNKQDDTSHLPTIENEREDLNEQFEASGKAIYAHHSGYLQAVDSTGLFNLASERNIALKVHFTAGDYLLKGSELACCLQPDDAFDKDEEYSLECRVNDHFIVGDTRTAEQDAKYAIRQLVEVALRALSPGINDPFTATTCIDRLGSAMVMIIDRQFPNTQHFDDEAHLRLQLKSYSFASLLGTAFNQIRQNCIGHVEVVIKLLEILSKLAEQANNEAHKTAIRKQAEAVFTASEASSIIPQDLAVIKQEYEKVRKALKRDGADKGEDPAPSTTSEK